MFPGGRPPSIFSAKKLNYCVRNGNRCDLLAITTEETLRFINSDPISIIISTEPRSLTKTLRLPNVPFHQLRPYFDYHLYRAAKFNENHTLSVF